MPNKSSSNSQSTYYKVTKKFEKFSDFVNNIVGSPYWFAFSVLLIVVWFPTGFFLGFNEIWHLLINSTTTILTFLMMSLLHASQSKWEQKMERIQTKEKTIINAIQQDTKKIAEENIPSLEDTRENSKNSSNNSQEHVSSIM